MRIVLEVDGYISAIDITFYAISQSYFVDTF